MSTNDYHSLTAAIRKLLSEKETVLIAIDGRCASGKTTLSEKLQKEFSCNVIHMDDFYLPMHLRDDNWKTSPAKNIDFKAIETILNEIPHKKSFEIRPYICSKKAYGEPIGYDHNPLTVIEGSYSTHPFLKRFYDFCIFLDISEKEQKNRLIKRNGEEGYLRFQDLWIPLEERYLQEFRIRDDCHMIL